MMDVYDMIELLDNIERDHILEELKDCLAELDRYRLREERWRQAAHPEDQRWKLAGRDDAPTERQTLYLTVQEKDSEKRMLIEGRMEDGKWYNDDGASLEARGLEIIAWLPKDLPEPYLGDR